MSIDPDEIDRPRVREARRELDTTDPDVRDRLRRDRLRVGDPHETPQPQPKEKA